ncbi:transposase [Streptomyces dubilierae]|uniref:transposase n=1 Tax=Streptomyces dubilierae TaxID=3075533 RepID=UPI00374DFC3F
MATAGVAPVHGQQPLRAVARSQVTNGILHRVRTGVQWRDLPERYGHGRPAKSATGAGRPTEPGNGCSGRCRTRSMPPVGSCQPGGGPCARAGRRPGPQRRYRRRHGEPRKLAAVVCG